MAGGILNSFEVDHNLYYIPPMPPFSAESRIALLSQRVPKALKLLEDCTVCPRECHVNRMAGETSICGMDARLKVSSANLHFGEEPPISGYRGSGTIFLSGCNLTCAYCQNYPISQIRHGEYMTSAEVAEAMLELERRGAHNINFVTPTHYVPQLMESMLIAYRKGLSLPIVYNSSGYDKVESLRLLDGMVDIYMPDMRYSREESSLCYSQAKDYPEVNQAAIREMHRQVGDLLVDSEGIADKGLLVRHLVLPEGIAGSREIFEFLANEISANTHVSVMSQYFPANRAPRMPGINRRLKNSEFKEAVDAFHAAGLHNGYIQPYPQSYAL